MFGREIKKQKNVNAFYLEARIKSDFCSFVKLCITKIKAFSLEGILKKYFAYFSTIT